MYFIIIVIKDLEPNEDNNDRIILLCIIYCVTPESGSLNS